MASITEISIPMNRVTNIYSCCLLVSLVACTGCSTFKAKSTKVAKSLDVRRVFGHKADEPAPPEVPLRMVSSWTDTVLSKTDKKPQRGFGGRLTFFGQDRESLIRVDGQLVVYAFEETEGQPRSTQPTRRYVFPREQFVRHESESTLGPSYSVWLPWDEVGGERKNISLIARFEPKGGPLLVGEQTSHLLPGRAVLVKEDVPAVNSGVKLAKHNATRSRGHASPAVATEELPQSKLKMTTTSIPLSKNWQRRLAMNQNKNSDTQEESLLITEPEPASALQP